MQDREPTIRTRVLGAGLRAAMKRMGLNGQQVAELLNWSPSWVSRLLSGKRGGSEVDVSAFLAVCKVTGAERDRLLALSREQHTPGWWQQHGSRLPKQLVTARLGAHAGAAGSFMLMEFAEINPLVYLESETSSLFLEKPEEIQAYQRILGALAKTALGEGESRELIAALATELYADRKNHDDRA